MADITKLEAELWEAADELRANSKLSSQEYCMPVLGLIFCDMHGVALSVSMRRLMRNVQRLKAGNPQKAPLTIQPKARCICPKRHGTIIW